MNVANKSVVLILALVAAIGASIMLVGRLPGPAVEPQHALRLPEPRDLPDFRLLDQDGNAISNDWFNGRWTMVFFGFTHCPDICPTTLSVLSAARQRMAETNSDAPLPDILLISVDPERDTPQMLGPYVRHFGEGVSGATGPIEEIRKLTTAFGIFFEREASAPEEPPENYNVAHSAHVIIVDDHGRYNAVFGPPHTVAAFATDMPVLMAAP